MGLGSQEITPVTYYCSPRAKNKDKKTEPHFKMVRKDRNGSIDEIDDETKLSGTLIKLDHSEYEFEGKKNKTIIIWLKDYNTKTKEDELFKIEANVKSNMIRGIMNTICGTIKYDRMTILLKEKDGFANALIFNGNPEIKSTWKFDYKKDIEPLIVKVPDQDDPNKMVNNYVKVQELLWNAWLEAEKQVAAFAAEKGRTLDVEMAQKDVYHDTSKAEADKLDRHSLEDEHHVDLVNNEINNMVRAGEDDEEAPF